MLLVPHSAEPPTTYGGGSGLARAADVVCRPVAAGCRTRDDDRAAPRLDRDRCPARRRSMVRAGLGRLGRGGSASAERRDGRRTLSGAAAPPSRVGGADRTPRLPRSSRRRCNPLCRGCRRQHRRGSPAESVPRPVLLEQLHRQRLSGAAGAGAGALAADGIPARRGRRRRWPSGRWWSGVSPPAGAAFARLCCRRSPGSASPSPLPSPPERSCSTAPSTRQRPRSRLSSSPGQQR